MMSLRFLTFTFWNSYVLKLLHLETLTFCDVTLSDIKLCDARFVVTMECIPEKHSAFNEK
jgi:hypothetical protein